MNALTPTADSATTMGPASTGRRAGLAASTLGAIGVVYGDIGTSPLYTVKEVFAPATGVALNATNLIGAVSVMFWALMLVVTLKYVVLILRADNHGEGGVLALAALAGRAVQAQPRLRHALLLLGVLGATLVATVPILLTAILAEESNRPGIDLAGAGKGSLHPGSLLTGLIANLYGASGPLENFWGPPSPAWEKRFGPLDLLSLIHI